MNIKACFVLVQLFFVLELSCNGQMDSLILENQNQLKGNIKSMNQGVLIFGTAYTKSDIQLKWESVSEIYSEKSFLVFTVSGRRYYGKLITLSSRQFVIKEDDGTEVPLMLEEITLLQTIQDNYLDRFHGSVDLGFTLTQAKNQTQLTLRSNLIYTSQEWYIELNTNHFSNNQSEVDRILRGDGNLSLIYLFKNHWFGIAKIDYLYNTQQMLDLRRNTKLGGGRFIFKNNYFMWNILAGGALNIEDYAALEDHRASIESWLGSQLHLFNSGRLSFQNNCYLYAGITEKGRIRIDNQLDLKYGLPLSLYIRTGITFNYDNQPVEEGVSLDYIWQTSFGWMFGR